MLNCIIPSRLEEYRKALKERKLDIKGLLGMTTEQRISAFKPFAGENAELLNQMFEQKLVLKNKLAGLKNFVNKTAELKRYSPEGKAELQKSLEEYKSKQQERILNPKEEESFLNALADKVAGTHIDKPTAKKIYELSSGVKDVKEKGAKLSGVSDEYLIKKQELNDFIQSQEPLSVTSSILKDVVVIGRNNLIMNPSVPIKATTGQIENTIMDTITRRLGTGTLKGENDQLVKKANSEAWETFKKTGVNTAAMEDIDDTHILGKGENFKVPKEANIGTTTGIKVAKAVNVVARVSNKIAIDWEHNISFVKFYQKNFFDMVDLISTQMAKIEKAGDIKGRSAEIFKDACRIEPQTEEGAMLRKVAQEQSARITSTNNTIVSNMSLGAKRWLNTWIPNFPLGDFIVPIAKIPANVVANAIDNAGAGIPMALRDIYQGREKIQSDSLKTKYEGLIQFHRGVQRAMRIGGTIGTAFLIASHFNKKDFKTDRWGAHFVKIGKVWVNMEYMSVISPALAGALTIKSGEDKTVAGKSEEYLKGALQGLKSVPGADEAEQIIQTLTSNHLAKSVEKYMSDFFSSRGEPAFLKNMQKNRPTNRLFFGAHGVETQAQVQEDKNKNVNNKKERFSIL